MRSYGTFEAKNKFSELLDCVERGEEVEITRRGKPVARLVAAPARRSPEEIEAALERLRELRAQLKADGVTFSREEILAYRDEGRR